MIILWDETDRTAMAAEWVQRIYPRKRWWGFPNVDSFLRLPYRNIIHEVDRQEDGIFFTFSDSHTALVQSISDLGYFVVVYIQGVSSWSEKSKYFDERTFQHIIRLGAQELDNRVFVNVVKG